MKNLVLINLISLILSLAVGVLSCREEGGLIMA